MIQMMPLPSYLLQ